MTLVFASTLDRGTPSGTAGSGGITTLRFDSSSGSLEKVSFIGGIGNPMSMGVDNAHGKLHAVSDLGGPSGGKLSTFTIDRTSGELRLLRQRSTGGSKPLYVSVDPRGAFVYVANLGSGSIAVLPLDQDGVPAESSHLRQHEGSSVDPKRQEGPHVHCVIPDPSGRFVLAADLGTDRVSVYALDRASGTLAPMANVSVQAGLGPRHLEFGPDGSTLFLVSEMGSAVTVFRWDPDASNGARMLEHVATASTLPPGHTEANSAADVHVSPDGRYLYCSNRGHDSLAVFQVESSGEVRLLGHELTRGRAPQIFALSDDGRFVFVGNRDSDEVAVFRRRPETGLFDKRTTQSTVRVPVCVRVLHRP